MMDTLSVINHEALRDAPLIKEPYLYVLIPDFVPKEYKGQILGDFPRIRSREVIYGGTISPQDLRSSLKFFKTDSR